MNSSWQAKQSIPHTTEAFYVNAGKCAKTSPQILATKDWLLHHGNASSHISIFNGEIFYPKQHDCCPHPPYFYMFP
jgi:hypothetical protein